MVEVTVLIPCYNAASYVAQAIQSVLDQGWQKLDVLVVDDGSTDGSGEIVSSFGPPVRMVSQSNRGVSCARNTGILASDSQFIMLLDADDLMLPGCLEARVAQLSVQQDCGFLIGSYSELLEDGTLVPRKHRGTPRKRIGLYEMLGGEYCVGQSGMLVRRSTFDRVGGFDPLLSACEDWDWQVRAAAVTGAAFDPEPRIAYRQVAGSASRSALKMVDGVEVVIQKNRIFANSRALFSKAAFSGRFNTFGSMLFHRTLRERGSIGGLLCSRPTLIPYFALWAGRAVLNRVTGVQMR